MTQFETVQDDSARGLLSFWFEELAFDDWFTQKDDVDARLKSRFGHLVDAAAAGKLDHWRNEPLTMQALILVLDQLPRNLFRGSARAFALDDQALAAARHYLDQFHDAFMDLSAQQKLFVLLPFEHAEDLAAQETCVGMFEQLAPTIDPAAAEFWANTTDYARRHLEPISLFGRFPHRNQVLGRETTAAEAAWLAQHPDGF